MFRHWIPVSLLLILWGCGGGGTGTSATTSSPAQTSDSVLSQSTAPTNNPTPNLPSPADIALRALLSQNGVTPVPTPPPQSPAQVALGEALMFDKILSGNQDTSCATCHHPSLASGDGLSTSIGTGGVGLGPARSGAPFIARNATPLWNRANKPNLFWDGRVSGNPGQGFLTPAGASLPAGLNHLLAAQAMFPVATPDEMLGTPSASNEVARLGGNDLPAIWGLLMGRLKAVPEYVNLFQAAFPNLSLDQLGFQHAANAIGAFEIERFSPLNSPFDRYLAGDNTALSDPQKRGAQLFFGTARCAVCHRGPLLSDFAFHNIAMPQVGPGKSAEAPLDFGRGRETGQASDRFRFATPILRNVAVTGPWSHSGSYTSLAAVVRHYINPAQALRNYNPAQLDPRLQSQVHVADQLAAGILNNLDPVLGPGIPLNPNEVNDLVAFLESLTDPSALQVTAPTRVPSGLPLD